MIKVVIICFTKKGLELAERIRTLCADTYSMEVYAKFHGFEDSVYPKVSLVEGNLSDWALDMQMKKYPLVFIGAMGIAVRAIAAGMESKLSDSPVVVIDEMGKHVIPVIGGHMGGANEIALHIATAIDATPVLTTATDLEECFAVDLFAKENQLSIYNKDGIAKVSSKSLEGKILRLSIENYPPNEAEIIVSGDKSLKSNCDILLCPKKYAVGMGCKKGTEFEALKDFFLLELAQNEIDVTDVGAIASIDLKENEEGLVELCRYFRIPFITYTPELLEKARGEFEESDFVKEMTGIGNVCERAAMLLTNNRGRIVQKKCVKNGMTLAIVEMV